MSGSKVILFDAEGIIKLWTHYTEGIMPLDAELAALAVDTVLPRQICFIVNSKQWQDSPVPGKDYYNPLHLRYEGGRVLSWGKFGTDPFWENANETPKFQG